VALSLLGYFFCMITVLTTAVAVMVGLFNVSTSQGVIHYPRAVAERNVTATNGEPRLFMVVPETKGEPPAKDIEANSAVISTEKADAKRSKPHKPKIFARQRNNFERRGYAQEIQYGPQRLFSNW
jgi:hypothetical protein